MAYYTKLDESIYPSGYADLNDGFYDGSGVYGQLNRKSPYSSKYKRLQRYNVAGCAKHSQANS